MKSVLALLSVLALPVMAAEPTLYGRYEYIKLPEIGETLKAKMDTGALTASLSAKNIQTFTRDGEEWVRFQLATEGASSKVYEHKVARISKIKSRADEDEDRDTPESARRPVVDLEMCLGNVKRTVEVNLTDRSSFNYPLLIGAKALREFGAAVYGGQAGLLSQPLALTPTLSRRERVGVRGFQAFGLTGPGRLA